jgi:gluconate 2-dehydrogenase gamma chain
MPNDSDGRCAPRDVSRRHLFKQVGLAGAAAAVSAAVPAAATAQGAAGATPGAVPKPEAAPAPPLTPPAASPAMPRLEALETLTAAEADTLEAIVARLIPTDENGPGATEARAAHYIDRALTGPLRGARASYAANLAALDAYAQSSKGAPFAKLAAAEQDAVLIDMEKGVATGFTPNAAAFFALVRTHTIQGTFCDPYYGGNADFVGWDLLGYPGIRLTVTAEEQRMGARPKPVRQSAYADASFAMSGAGKKGGGHGHRP